MAGTPFRDKAASLDDHLAESLGTRESSDANVEGNRDQSGLLPRATRGWNTDSVLWWKRHGGHFSGLDFAHTFAHTFVYLGDVVIKQRNRLINASTKAVLVIKSWMGHPEAGS
jgi:hypothetical protein